MTKAQRKCSLPLSFPRSEAILAAISAGETPALPGGVNAYHHSVTMSLTDADQ